MDLTLDMLRKIKEEIVKDPDKLGYDGKSDKDIATLLNSSVFKERVVVDAHPSPINRILRGVADGPNEVTETDIAQAKVIL